MLVLHSKIKSNLRYAYFWIFFYFFGGGDFVGHIKGEQSPCQLSLLYYFDEYFSGMETLRCLNVLYLGNRYVKIFHTLMLVMSCREGRGTSIRRQACVFFLEMSFGLQVAFGASSI